MCVCVCVYVCVCVRERERQTDRQTDRQTEKERVNVYAYSCVNCGSVSVYASYVKHYIHIAAMLVQMHPCME